jgi:ATP-dependent Lhr-like helicase
LDIPVIPWHGDISVTLKKKFLKAPKGCLLITPESLEGLLMREGHSLSRVFGSLRYIVIDELHAFIDTERGKQLQSLLHRVDVALKRRIPRIGLSATLGEMHLAAEFLRPNKVNEVVIINSSSFSQELKVLVKGFYNKLPRLDKIKSRIQQTAGVNIELDEEIPEGMAAIGDHLFKTLRGSNNLIFPNSRGLVEFYADLLRRACEHNSIANEFWPHHGSLSKTIREETERALKAGDKPATAIATTTLELGIDIGAVKSIAQIGPAPSVASLRQRLGRSGRLKGEAAILRCYCLENSLENEAPLSDKLHEGLIQTIAQIRLLISSWFEPPRVQNMHLSTLVQQLLSLIAQYGGLHADQAWSFLCCSGLFPALSKSEFAELLHALGEQKIIMQDAMGLLLHGTVGEKIVNHYSFLAAFISPEEFRLVCEGKQLGTLPLDRPLIIDSFLIFAGRRWKVTGCSPEEKLIQVVPARGGKVPLFDGMGGKVHDRVRQEMRAVLHESTIVPFLDTTAMAQLHEARETYQHLALDNQMVIQSNDGVQVLTWQGDWVNDTLTLMLLSRGFHAMNNGLYIHVTNTDVNLVLKALYAIAHEPQPSGEVLTANIENKYREKWDRLLPEVLLNKNYASIEIEVPLAKLFQN